LDITASAMPSFLKVVGVDWLHSNAFKHKSLRYLVNLSHWGSQRAKNS